MTADPFASDPFGSDPVPDGWLAVVRLPLAPKQLALLARVFPGAVLEGRGAPPRACIVISTPDPANGGGDASAEPPRSAADSPDMPPAGRRA